jgi:class 3 adenylate cyclase
VQRTLAAPAEEPPIAVRIGVSAGEPVAERGDLFGSVVQLAARLCARAAPGSVLVSTEVRDLALRTDLEFRKLQPLRLKGFEKRIPAYEVAWGDASVATSAP